MLVLMKGFGENIKKRKELGFCTDVFKMYVVVIQFIHTKTQKCDGYDIIVFSLTCTH